MAEPVQQTTREDRCDKCGTIRFTLDPPIDLIESDEILRDEVWAVYRQAWTPQAKMMEYIDSLFHTETSAFAEMRRQIEEGSHPYGPGRAIRIGDWIDTHTWRFLDDDETISVRKVDVRL